MHGQEGGIYLGDGYCICLLLLPLLFTSLYTCTESFLQSVERTEGVFWFDLFWGIFIFHVEGEIGSLPNDVMFLVLILQGRYDFISFLLLFTRMSLVKETVSIKDKYITASVALVSS